MGPLNPFYGFQYSCHRPGGERSEVCRDSVPPGVSSGPDCQGLRTRRSGRASCGRAEHKGRRRVRHRSSQRGPAYRFRGVTLSSSFPPPLFGNPPPPPGGQAWARPHQAPPTSVDAYPRCIMGYREDMSMSRTLIKLNGVLIVYCTGKKVD